MSEKEKTWKGKCYEMEDLLKKSREEAKYYKGVAEEAGKKRLREVDQLSNFLADLKRAEEALKESEERYRSLVENTLYGYFIVEYPSARFVFLNRRIFEIFGYRLEENSQLTVWDVAEPDEHQILKEQMQAMIRDRSVTYEHHRYTGVRKDGSVFRAEVCSSLVTFQGKLFIQGVIRDVTEEENLNKRLQEAQKMEAIGTLAGGIAHDFNNLLMAMQGNVSLMLHDINSTHPHYEGLKNVEKCVRSGAKLTRQLLGYARKGKYEVKVVDLNQLIEETSEAFGRTRKEITIHQELAGDMHTVEADRGQMEQMLLNLYINAGDAMPGGGKLTLKTENTSYDDIQNKPYDVKPGKYVLLKIIDTGIGMDKGTMAHIFEPFFTTKEMGRGTGLGLASVYGIVKGHGGYIDVESEKRDGTTFSVYLPASDKKIRKPVNGSAPVIEGNETILIVEDEAMVLEVGVKLLKSIGYTVFKAGSGMEAIDIYKENKDTVDMIILDMVMPDMGGGEVYDRVKQINPDVKVLLSSGYSIDGKARDILGRGCNGFIQKPFNMKDLSRKIVEILSR
jgi:two-component system, cell cycle sensor histidine kinase and response regulator CckA